MPYKETMKSYSQQKEDLFIKSIFDDIGIDNEVSVEFGGADGYRQSNTRLFADNGWTSHFWDVNPEHERVIKEMITPDNVNDIFDKYEVPQSLDLLSIDIDSNEYWVWKALERRPRIIIIEFNPSIPMGSAKTIELNPNFQWNKTNYYGASYSALKMLGEYKGYDLVACIGCNMIFTLKELNVTPNADLTYKCKSGWPVDHNPKNIWIDVSKDLK